MFGKQIRLEMMCYVLCNLYVALFVQHSPPSKSNRKRPSLFVDSDRADDDILAYKFRAAGGDTISRIKDVVPRYP